MGYGCCAFLSFLNISHVLSQIQTGGRGGLGLAKQSYNGVVWKGGLRLSPVHFAQASREKHVLVLPTDVQLTVGALLY